MMLIEKVVLDHLKMELNMTDVYLEAPEVLPEKFVLFRVEDRGKVNQIDAVTFEIHSEADSKLDAAELDQKVRKAMGSLINDNRIASSKLGGGRDEADNVLKKYRYVCYYNVIFYND